MSARCLETNMNSISLVCLLIWLPVRPGTQTNRANYYNLRPVFEVHYKIRNSIGGGEQRWPGWGGTIKLHAGGGERAEGGAQCLLIQHSLPLSSHFRFLPPASVIHHNQVRTKYCQKTAETHVC